MLCSWKSASSPAAAARRATAKLDFSDDDLGDHDVDDHLVVDGDDLDYHDDATMISTRCCDIQVNRR